MYCTVLYWSFFRRMLLLQLVLFLLFARAGLLLCSVVVFVVCSCWLVRCSVVVELLKLSEECKNLVKLMLLS